MTAGNKIWAVDSSVRFRRLLDEAVVIQQEKAAALVLNDTAISFLELCDGHRTVDEIIAAMVDDFEVSSKQMTEDLAPFIRELAEEGIIKSLAVPDVR